MMIYLYDDFEAMEAIKIGDRITHERYNGYYLVVAGEGRRIYALCSSGACGDGLMQNIFDLKLFWSKQGEMNDYNGY